MKRESPRIKTISLALVVVMLSSCTVYQKVPGSPVEASSKKTVLLFMDELKFVLDSVSIQNNTIRAKVYSLKAETSHRDKMIIQLKPDQNPEQLEDGFIQIPFGSIKSVECFEVDGKKSRTATYVSLAVGVVGGAILYVVIAYMITKDTLEQMSFKI